MEKELWQRCINFHSNLDRDLVIFLGFQYLIQLHKSGNNKYRQAFHLRVVKTKAGEIYYPCVVLAILAESDFPCSQVLQSRADNSCNFTKYLMSPMGNVSHRAISDLSKVTKKAEANSWMEMLSLKSSAIIARHAGLENGFLDPGYTTLKMFPHLGLLGVLP